MAGRVLGIEFSSDRTAIVEASYGRQLKIFNFAVIESGAVEPERRIEQLQHTLKLRGFEAREAIVAVSGSGIEHRLLNLPQMSDRQLGFVMQREARKVAEVPDFASSYELLHTDEHLGIRKLQILLVTAEQSIVQRARAWFSQTPLKVQRLTSVPEALSNLCRNTGLDRREGLQTIAHISGGRLHLIFIQGGLMVLCRDVQFEFGGVSQDELVRRLITEIRRSILMFRQNFPQAQIGQIIFSGAVDFLGTIAAQSKEELGIETSVIRFEDLLDRASFRGDWDEFRFHLPGLAVAIGAAWRKTASGGINLLPGKTSTGTGVSGTLAARIVAGAVLAVTLAAGVYYGATVSTLNGERAALEVRGNEIQPRVDQAEATQRQRSMAANTALFLDQTHAAADWTELFRALSIIVPSTAVMDSVQMSAPPQAPASLTLRGNLIAPTAQQANADFTRFFNSLRGLGHFSAVVLSRPLTIVNEGANGAAGAGFQSRLGFEVQCQLAAKK